jgi:hypothetical protein
MPFAYSAAYLSYGSERMFKELGVNKDKLHMTTCFDTTATIKPENNIDIVHKTAVIANITEWETPSGLYVVAELTDCGWSAVMNAHYKALGAIEDLPHNPHITLMKSSSPELVEKLKVLVGREVVFNDHAIKVKGL